MLNMGIKDLFRVAHGRIHITDSTGLDAIYTCRPIKHKYIDAKTALLLAKKILYDGKDILIFMTLNWKRDMRNVCLPMFLSVRTGPK